MLTPPIEIRLAAGETGQPEMLTPPIEIRLAAGETGQQEMLTPPRHLVPPPDCPEVPVCPIFRIVFHTGFISLVTVRFITLLRKELFHNFNNFIVLE
jgi:hypothetical protein